MLTSQTINQCDYGLETFQVRGIYNVNEKELIISLSYEKLLRKPVNLFP